ncbi:MAG TPA: HdeD family acid-resistance protein [Candidatus Methylomirabilis sp.]|nr:HdeD family acid-resistance protein [Candidatus Methylomirabilis sp.]
MNMVLVRNWWALALRGLAAILFGLLAFLLPAFTLLWLVLLFGVYVVVDGVFSIVAGIRAAERHERWWPFALEGLASIVLGVLTFVMPAATALVLVYFVSAWAIVTGAIRIGAAIRLRRDIEGEWLLILSGALSVLFGILIIARPAAGLVTLVWLVGAYAAVYGMVLVALAFRLRGHTRRAAAPAAKTTSAR